MINIDVEQVDHSVTATFAAVKSQNCIVNVYIIYVANGSVIYSRPIQISSVQYAVMHANMKFLPYNNNNSNITTNNSAIGSM